MTLLGAVLRYYREYENDSYVYPVLKRHRELACAGKSSNQEEIRYLNSNQEVEFLEILKQKPLFYDLAILQLDTGVRIGEAAALEFKNIDFFRKEVRIAQHLHWVRKKGGMIDLLPGTKTGPNRVILLTDRCLEVLKRRRTESFEKVFMGKDGSWLAYRSIQDAYDRAFAEMKIEH